MIAIRRFLLFCLFFSFVSAETWDRNLKLDPNYEIWWSMDDDSITFQIEVATGGWIGFGISPNGGMAGSDMVIGWINDGEVVFHDRNAEGKFLPEIDEQQDWQLLWHQKNDTHTKFRFKRLLDTCDDQDMLVTDETTRLIYAYNPESPDSLDAISYHGPTRRGSKSIFLKTERNIKHPENPKDLLYWDVRSPNVVIPEGSDTEYLCTFVRVPFLDRKHHIIQVDPLIQSGNEKLVHHVLLYECSGTTNETVSKYKNKKYHSCYTKDRIPKFPFCLTVTIGWAIGGDPFYFPENTGLPLGLPDVEWFLLEIHYDNPGLKKAVDSSGLRLTYTPKLRRYDSSVLGTGNLWYPCMVVPPRQKEFIMSAHVSPSCLNQRIPPEGIKVIAVLLHSHLLGRKMLLRHFRGNEELAPIISDRYYDFNLQEFRKLSKIRTILPNDHLILECSYDSSKKNSVTFGGLSTKDEMCIAFLIYYPRLQLAITTSCPLPKNLLYSLGVKHIYHNDELLNSPITGKNESYFSFLNNYPWNENSINVARKAMAFSPQINLCTDRGWKLIPTFVLSTYPKVTKSYREPNKCGSRKGKRKQKMRKSSRVPFPLKTPEYSESRQELKNIDSNIRQLSNFSILPYPVIDAFFLNDS